jgi:hypothetical protein
MGKRKRVDLTTVVPAISLWQHEGLKMDFEKAVSIMRSFRSFGEQRLKEKQH